MLFQGDQPHPAHKIFGDAIGCTYRHFESGRTLNQRHFASSGVTSRVKTALSLSREFDIVVAEGTAPLQTALAYGTIRNPSATLIYLGADQTFYTLSERRTRYIWRLLKPLTNNRIDGCIAISELVFQWGLPYHGSIPKRIVHPPMSKSRFKALSSLDPSSSESPFVILSVGHARPMKNHSELVTAVSELRSEYETDLKLVLIGRGHKTAQYADLPWVETPGEIPTDETESFVEYHGTASLYVHPSRADGFGVAVTEAMLGGTPTIATTHVGASEMLPEYCVCRPTATDLRSAIDRLYRYSEEERIDLAQQNRKAVQELTVENQVNEFRMAVEKFSERSLGKYNHGET